MKKGSLFLVVLVSAVVTLTAFVTANQNSPTSFKEVKIGKQVWMLENLNVEQFKNGSPILEAKTADDWKRAGENGTPAWCYYNNDPANAVGYGKLYNWYAVTDPRGLAPEGWKIPSVKEWNSLVNNAGGEDKAGKSLKSTAYWAALGATSGGGTNESGFDGLPGGYRDGSGGFSSIAKTGCWWGAGEYSKILGNAAVVYYENDRVGGRIIFKTCGYSVRCIKD
jgi:uncharacterized protein (TIGR02145 family)